MPLAQLSNKKIAIFGIPLLKKNFLNFLTDNNVSIIAVDEEESQRDKKSSFIVYQKSDEINWFELECIIINKENKALVEKAEKNGCPFFSAIEFFEQYFASYNYTGIIGESGSDISRDIMKFLFCKLKNNIDYDIAKKEELFTLNAFGKTNDYVIQLTEAVLKNISIPHFNNIVLFDLDYDDMNITKIRNMILKQSEIDITILNINDKNVRNFYKELQNNANYKSKIIPISTQKIMKNGISFVNNEIYVNLKDKNNEYFTSEFKKLEGEQNRINILAIFTFFLMQNFLPEEIIENLYNFEGSDEIFEVINHKENYSFVNDIKNKNKEQSLISFDNIYWILCIDEAEFEFSYFKELKEHLNKIKYIFILGSYNENVLQIFKENKKKYFINYDMQTTLNKIKELLVIEKKEEKITILLSSINDIENNIFYENCSKEFEKLIDLEK